MPALKVLTIDEQSGALVLGIPRPQQMVKDIDLLVQIVALTLLNNGGRSIIRPGWAGGVRRLLGTNVDPDDMDEVFADFRIMVSMVEQLIKEDQVGTRRGPSERLQSLQLIDVGPDSGDLAVIATIAVISETHDQSRAIVRAA